MGPDLATMYNNGMGATASGMAGQMFSADQAQQAEKLKTMQLENAQSALMNPLNAQFKQGQLAQQSAELPGIQGQSMSLGAKGQEDVATMSAKIATQFSNMSTQIGKNGMEQMSQDAEKLNNAAQVMKQYPPAMQKQVLTKYIQQYGGNPNSPMFSGLLQAPDEMVQAATETLGKGMAMASSKFTTDSATHAAANASHEKIAAGNNATSLENTKILAKARVDAADTRSKAAMNHMNLEGQINYLTNIPLSDRTPDEQAQLLEKTKLLFSKETAKSPSVAPIVLGQDTPQQTAIKTAESIVGGGKAAPTMQPPAGYKLTDRTKNGVPVYRNAEGHQITWSGK